MEARETYARCWLEAATAFLRKVVLLIDPLAGEVEAMPEKPEILPGVMS